VRSAPTDNDFLDRSLALYAGFAFAAIGAVLDLKKAGLAIGIHIVRDGRPASGNRQLQDFLQRGKQLAQLGFRQCVGSPTGSDVGAKQRFIGINVPHAVQQLLVQESCFNWGFAAMKQLGEIICPDLERLGSGSTEAAVLYFQPPETPRIDEA
jgi:hypothetical protein